MKTNQVTKIVLTALFAAMAFVATYIIRIPTVGTNGYVNIGDTIVLLSAWMIGGIYGGLAAGIGSALSDFSAGYGMYVPGTFVIKFLMAVAAYVVFNLLRKANVHKIIGYAISRSDYGVWIFFIREYIIRLWAWCSSLCCEQFDSGRNMSGIRIYFNWHIRRGKSDSTYKKVYLRTNY